MLLRDGPPVRHSHVLTSAESSFGAPSRQTEEAFMFYDTVSNLVNRKPTNHVLAVEPAASVATAVALMNRNNVGAVLVANGNGLEGILTERDVLQRLVEAGLDAGKTPVRNIMTRNPKTIRADERAARALEIMSHQGFRHLPVMEGKELKGIVSLRDLNAWMIDELQSQTDGALMAVKSMGMSNRRG
jgi:CBS domain-containing protein